MSATEYPLQATVRELESVTSEISRLRDAVEQHREAAIGLESVAVALGKLSSLLPSLPSEIRSQFAGVPALVSSLEDALRPAGALELSLNALVESNVKLLETLRVEREEAHAMMGVVRDDAAALRTLVRQFEDEARSRHEGLNSSVMERATSGEVVALSAVIEVLAESIQAVHEDVRELAKIHGERSSTQAQDTELIKARLAKLTGLARRGFLAILRGKDAAADPL